MQEWLLYVKSYQKVPWNHDLKSHLEKERVDGIFISNGTTCIWLIGPGNPKSAQITIDHLKQVITSPRYAKLPIFGICMGHQLLGMAGKDL